MPGRGSYGPGGKWIYQRAKHLRAKNPDMEESTSFAIATQQAHKVNKSPKGFRTAEGVRTAKAKMRRPIKEYRKTASAEEAMLHGFVDEMEKISGGLIGKMLTHNLTPGVGPLRKRLAMGFKGLGQLTKSQIKRHGLVGALT